MTGKTRPPTQGLVMIDGIVHRSAVHDSMRITYRRYSR